MYLGDGVKWKKIREGFFFIEILESIVRIIIMSSTPILNLQHCKSNIF